MKTECQFEEKYEKKIDSIIGILTLEEKVQILHGIGIFESAGIERLGIPGLKYTDGPTGVREETQQHSFSSLGLTTDSVTFFPTGTALAATWNPELALKQGEGLGMETRSRGKDILLGPGVNIIRTPVCGRTFEYFTEDPFLNSQIAVGYIRGVQSQDAGSCIKHYIANNQEFERGRVSVEMSERTFREIYLPAFRAAVENAGVMGAMGAYNKFRGEYLCHNAYLNQEILKDDLGFKGIVISDWGATHSTMKAALGGLDIEMGTRGRDYDSNYMALPLRDSVLVGKVPEEVIDDKVRRILRVIYNLEKLNNDRKQGSRNTVEISNIVYSVAAEAIVLLKNENKILPLNKKTIKSIAVIGQNATQPQSFGGFTASVKAKYEVSPLEGLKSKLGDSQIIEYAAGYEPKFKSIEGLRMPVPDNTPNEALIAEAVEKAKQNETVILFVGTNRTIESEAWDRLDIMLPFGQDELIKAVTEANPNTIVVVVAGAPCDLNIAKEKAPALLYSWYNGSEAGNAIADVLFGDVNPSGKLPFTIPVKLNDIAAHAMDAYPGKDLVVEYKEGILVGYRWFDTKDIDPLYCFGYGISYSDFEYTNLKANKKSYNENDDIELDLMVSNTSNLDGKEVVQCYIRALDSKVSRADKELKAFAKPEIPANESKNIQLKIKAKDLSYYDEEKSKWVLEPGNYEVLIGSSSRDIRLKKTISIK